MEAGGWQGGGGEAPLRPGEGEVSPLPPPSGSRILPAPSAGSRALGVPGGVFVFFFLIYYFIYLGGPQLSLLSVPIRGLQTGLGPRGSSIAQGAQATFHFNKYG